MTRCIALLSSGLDSTVGIALAIEQKTRIDLALTYDYGQRAAQNEIEHAGKIADYFDIPFQVITLDWFRNLGKSALTTNSLTLPNPDLHALDDQKSAEASADAVWVPNRNGVFIEVAASLAEGKNFDSILLGFNKEEAATFPDNSEAYLNAMNTALSFSTRKNVKVISPTLGMTKFEIVGHAVRLGIPFQLFWSCYEREEMMCGSCESCMRLKRAMAKNEVSFSDYFTNQDLK